MYMYSIHTINKKDHFINMVQREKRLQVAVIFWCRNILMSLVEAWQSLSAQTSFECFLARSNYSKIQLIFFLFDSS